MSNPTPPARKIQPLVWLLGGIGLLLVCATLTVGLLALRAITNAGFAFRFDAARKTLVMTKGDSGVVMTGVERKEVKPSGGDNRKPDLGMSSGTFLVENRHINPKLPGCTDWGQQHTGCVYVEFTYADLVGGPAEARERINGAITAFVTACWGGPEGDLCNDRRTQPSNNREFTPESLAQYILHGVGRFQKDHPSAFSSMLSRSVTVLRNAAPVFSLEYRELFYIGGTHPMSSTSYRNFDPGTGEPVKLASILNEGAMTRLTAIAEAHFRQARNLSATAKLDDEGFGFPGGRFALNDNYGFSEKALLFFFNDYENAPHAMGPTPVEIPYAEIRDLIRPGFPL